MIRHAGTQSLLNYWNLLRGERTVPRRDEIEPRNIKRLLPDIFLLGFEGPQQYRFRLAGTHLCEVFGIELRNFNLLDLWDEDCRKTMSSTLARVTGEALPMLVDFTAETPSQRSCSFELLLLPLATDDGRAARILGHTGALSSPYWLGDELLTRQWIERVQPLPIFPQTNVAVASARAALMGERPRLRLVATNDDSVVIPVLHNSR